MADTIRGVQWYVEKSEDTFKDIKGFLSWSRWAGFPGERKWLIELLQEIVAKNNLQATLEINFEVTRPLWFGFWIHSPLNKLQCSILHDLLEEMGKEVVSTLYANLEQKHQQDPIKFPATKVSEYKQIYDKDHQNLLEFLSALQVAMVYDLPIHVALLPPGHVDFGFHTIFPHCPRCKADPPIGKLDEREVTCPVCGNIYRPAETMSMEEDPLRKLIEKLDSKGE